MDTSAFQYGEAEQMEADFISMSDESESLSEEQELEEPQEEEERVYELPPLPPVAEPPTVRGIDTSEIYKTIVELRKRVDIPHEREQAATTLEEDPDVLLAVLQVLQEARLLRRPVMNEDGDEEEEEIVPQPEMPRLPLPTGYISWIVEN